MLEIKKNVGQVASPAIAPDAKQAPVTVVRRPEDLRLLTGFNALLQEIGQTFDVKAVNGIRAFYRANAVAAAPLMILESLHFGPVIESCVEKMRTTFARLTNGDLPFRFLIGHYGLDGHMPCSRAELSLRLGISIDDIVPLTAAVKRLLKTQAISDIMSDALLESFADFAVGPRCTSLAQHLECFLPLDQDQTELVPHGPDDKIEIETSDRFGRDQRSFATGQRETMSRSSLCDRIIAAGKIVVNGRAGAGKTRLAIDVVARLAQMGKRTLLIAHSRLNAADLQERVAAIDESIQVATFHSFCTTTATTAGIALPRSRSNYVFNHSFPRALKEAMHAHPELRYDAIVIDEGHFFQPNMLDALSCSLQSHDLGHMIVMVDESVTGPDSLDYLPFNTQIDLVHKGRPGADLMLGNQSFMLFEVNNRRRKDEALIEVVDHLLTVEGYSPNDIAILTTHQKSVIPRLMLRDEVKIRRSPATGKGKLRKTIYSGTVFSFRGQTAKVVILCDLIDFLDTCKSHQIAAFRQLLLGRASQRLIVLSDVHSVKALTRPDQQFV